WHRYCYVAVDETRRAMLGEMPVKSLDFIVYGEPDVRLLIDVKGRRFPSGTLERPRRVWECWSTRDDIEGLQNWLGLFGYGYVGLLVFTYLLGEGIELPEDTLDLFTFRGRRYLFRAVEVGDYQYHMGERSPKWGTVSLRGADFRRLVQPLHHFLGGPAAIPEEHLA